MDTIAKRYAEALFALAKEENAVKQYQKDMEKVEEIFQDSTILQFFSHVAIHDEDKYQVLDQCLKGQIETYVYQFLLLLIKKRRIRCILLICHQFQHLCYEYLGIQIGKYGRLLNFLKMNLRKLRKLYLLKQRRKSY